MPVTLRRAEVVDRLRQAWGTILFVVALFVVVAYLYARRPGPATGGLLVLGSGLLSSDLAIELGVSAADARGDPSCGCTCSTPRSCTSWAGRGWWPWSCCSLARGRR